jgi:gamma-glutamyltranspeptidase/glutathione hydrolase
MAFCSMAFLIACNSQFQYTPSELPPPPEGSSGWVDKPGWVAKDFMVAAANPLATDAGFQILEAGGSAVDAAIAIQMVLTLVEPQSSGIGGGAFLLHYDGEDIVAYDGRETAPQAAGEDLFIGPDGKKMSFREGVVGGRSVGTPGVVKMLELAHKKYGKLEWSELFEPAIYLAEKGFPISPRMNVMLGKETFLKKDEFAKNYFYKSDGTPKDVGTTLKNPQLATVLKSIAKGGSDNFYTGQLAKDIVNKVRSHPTNPGVLSLSDLEQYKAKEREALCFDYKRYRICGMPPPSSGQLAIGQILGILENTDIERYKPTQKVNKQWLLNSEAVHLYTEAARLAYADRALYVGDPDFVSVPVKGMLNKQYLAERATLIGEKSMGRAEAGVPEGAIARYEDKSPELPSTSHISIVDRFGNAIAMTTTIESGWGSRLMTNGFLLNNELTDFSFVSEKDGKLVANRVQPGKRPRSSMSPTLVFDKESNQLIMSVGSPGGSAIINYVGKTLVGTLDWGLNVQEAINLPNFGSRNGPTELEENRTDESLIKALEAKGHKVRVRPQTSGLQGIQRTKDGWFGGADPRREGVARGN